MAATVEPSAMTVDGPQKRLGRKGLGDPLSCLLGLTPESLLRHPVHLSPCARHAGAGRMSPAGLGCNRLAALNLPGGLRLFSSSGSHVLETVLELNSPDGAPAASGAALVDKGMEGVLVPRQSPQVLQLQPMTAARHQHEIQSLALAVNRSGKAALGSVDSQGVGCVNVFPAGGQAGNTLRLEPCQPVNEAGWAGIDVAWQHSDEPVAAIAMHFARQICVYEGGRCIRKMRTLHAPTAITLLPQLSAGGGANIVGPSLLACAESHQVSIWDVRQGEREGVVQRIAVAPGGAPSPVHSVAWCGAGQGLVGCAGVERCVTMLDPRKWRVVHKWPSAAKYAIHTLQFSKLAPHWCYLVGLDYECVVGRWDGTNTRVMGNANSNSGGHGRAVGPDLPEKEAAGAMSFRGDGRWLGLTLAQSSQGPGPSCSEQQEVAVAITQNASAYTLRAGLSS